MTPTITEAIERVDEKTAKSVARIAVEEKKRQEIARLTAEIEDRKAQLAALQ